MQGESHLPLEELKWLERVEKDADRTRRMRIVILAAEGWTAPAVAMAVGLWPALGGGPHRRRLGLLIARQGLSTDLGRRIPCDAFPCRWSTGCCTVWATAACVPVRSTARRPLRRSKSSSEVGRIASDRSPRSTPASNCESTCKTNRGSANKAQPRTYGLSGARVPRPSGKRNTSTCGCLARSAPRPDTPKDC